MVILEQVDKDGYSLLNLAVKCNIKEIVKFLIEEGADVNTQDNNQNTPLHWALICQNYEICDLLRSKKVDEDLANNKGNNAWQNVHKNLLQKGQMEYSNLNVDGIPDYTNFEAEKILLI